MSATNPLMPFGKHKGKKISELTDKYCLWLVSNVKLYGDVERAVKTRLGIALPPQETEEEKIDRVMASTITALQAAILEVDEALEG